MTDLGVQECRLEGQHSITAILQYSIALYFITLFLSGDINHVDC